jgi:adenylate cyclase
MNSKNFLHGILTAWIVIQLISSNLFAQNSDPEVDSLLVLLQNASTDTARVKLLYKLSWELNVSDAKEALLVGRQAQSLANKIQWKEGISLASQAIAQAHGANNDIDSAIYYWDISIEIEKNRKDTNALGRLYNNKGKDYLAKGEFVEAEKFLLQALEIYEKEKDHYVLNKVYTNLANLAYAQGDNVKMLNYDILSLKLLEETNDFQNIGSGYNNVAIDYQTLKEYNEAIVYAQKGIEVSHKHGNKYTEGACYLTLGDTYFLLGEKEKSVDALLKGISLFKEIGNKRFLIGGYNSLAEVHSSLGDLFNAKKCMEYSLELSREIEDAYYAMVTLHKLGSNANKRGDFEGALDYFQQARPFAEADSALSDLEVIYSGMKDSYVGLKNFEQAFYYSQLYNEVHDKILNETTIKELSLVRTEFETEKKQHALDLSEKDNELKSKEIGKQKIIRNTVVVGLLCALIFLIVVFIQKKRISKEKAISEELLLNILPYETAQELKAKGSAEAQLYDEVTVLFTDFKGFTMIAEKLSPKDLVAEIHHCFKAFDGIMEKYHIEKIKTIGDAYMAAGGLPVVNKANPVDVVKACLEIQAFMHDYAVQRVLQGLPVFEIRIGVHTGPVVAGIVGIKKFQYDIWGDTVNTASRMESSGEAGKVNVSATTFERIEGQFKCTPRGRIAAKNKGEIEMYFVDGLL